MTKLTDVLKAALDQKKTSAAETKKVKKDAAGKSLGKSQTTNSKVTTRGASRGS